MPHAVLWDLDGTLVETEECHRLGVCRNIAAVFGKTVSKEAALIF